MTTPERNINPHNIVTGMRVRAERRDGAWSVMIEGVVAAIEGGRIWLGRDSDDDAQHPLTTSVHTWTLLADAPEPERPVGSRWLDPETGAEYVQTDGVGAYDYTRIRAGVDQNGVGRRSLRSTDALDDQIIARLTPIPAFDPAALWPAADGDDSRRCGEWATGRDDRRCGRSVSHGGLHAVYVWGDPR